MSDRPKASIVVPAYNTEAYIGRALGCAAAQTERDIQVVVVDDGSTDSTLAIARKFAEKDPRFEVVHVENGGASRARNIGLDHARGEKLFFLDSDDEFSERLVKDCLSFAEAHDVSTVLYGYANQTVEGRGEPFLHELETEYRDADILEGLVPHFIGHSYEDVCEWIRGHRGMRQGKEHTALWRVMLDARVVRESELRFNESLDLGEDTIFMNTYLSLERSVGFLDECLYWLTAREGSLNWTSNNDPVSMARNKLKILTEKDRLARRVLAATGRDIAPLYAGTQVLSALQLCLELGRNCHIAPEARKEVLNDYLSDDIVQHCVEGFTPPISPKALPFLILKRFGGAPIMKAVQVASAFLDQWKGF